MSSERIEAGRYLFRCKEKSFLQAALNGHSTVWPEAEAVSDGTTVRFFKQGQQVWTCNAYYAAANFVFTAMD